jgi:hypothetical protein
MSPLQQISGRGQATRGPLMLALAGAAALLLGACNFDVAGIDCTKVTSDTLHVGKGQTCRFKYGGDDIARYVIQVTGAPTHGEAVSKGRYLTYIAKPGFVGDDRLTIKVERQGVGHVQWQTLHVKVKVGPTA